MFQKAKSVWSDTVCINQYIFFNQKFFLNELTDIKVFIRCHSNYVLFINERLLSFGQYPDYDFYKVYDKITVPKDFLLEGENNIKVLAYCQYFDTSTNRKAKPALIYEIKNGKKIIAFSGEDTYYSDKTGYLSGEMDLITGQLGFTFSYDSTISEGTYYKAQVFNQQGKYHLRPVKKLTITERCPSNLLQFGTLSDVDFSLNAAKRMYTAAFHNIQDKSILPDYMGGVTLYGKDDGIYAIFDLKKERCGYLTFDISVPENCLVDIGYGEHLDDNRVRSFVGGRNFGFSYRAKEGRNVFTHYFTRIAGRFLELHLYTKEVTLNYCGLYEAFYPIKRSISPKGLNNLEKNIYETCIDTLRLCMHEHYEDCPWREQALYAMDSRNQMLFGYYTFKEYSFAKASIRLLGLGLREDGLLELCAPAKVQVTIPSFSLLWVVSLYEYVEYSKDKNFGLEMVTVAKTICKTFENRLQDGLISIFKGDGYWNFYDWEKNLDGTENNLKDDSCINLFYAYALLSLKKLFLVLEDSKSAGEYEEKHRKSVEMINKKYWDKDKKGYLLFRSQTAMPELLQALAIVGETCTDNINLVLERMGKGEYTPKTTLSHKIFKYDAMMKDKSYLNIIRSEIANIWGNMLDKGATSFWETEKGADDFDKAGSLCHGWSAVPAYFYHRYMENK